MLGVEYRLHLDESQLTETRRWAQAEEAVATNTPPPPLSARSAALGGAQ